MANDDDHGACVDAWLARVARGVPAERLVHVFEQGFAALWRRAHRTLGDVTLTAIVDRVLYNSSEQYPELSVLVVETTGLHCEQLRASAGELHQAQLAEALRFVLVEFLTVLGNLTAEILTPTLHAALAKSTPEDNAAGNAADGAKS